jgi:hypothetical protein
LINVILHPLQGESHIEDTSVESAILLDLSRREKSEGTELRHN